MYPTQMRRHKIVWIFLILFIVNQVFGAPLAVREKLEGLVDADVTEGGTAALQKRVNPVEEGSNMAGQTPPSLDRTEVGRSWPETGELGMGLRPLRILASRTSPSSDLHWSSKGSKDSNLMPRTPPSPQTPPSQSQAVTPSTPPTRPSVPSVLPYRPHPSHKPVPPFRPFYRYNLPPYRPLYPYNPAPPYRSPYPYNPVTPYRPLYPYRPLPHYPLRPYIPPYRRPLRPVSPSPLSKEPLQPVSSLTTNKPSTTGPQLTPQQNSGPDLDTNPEPHLLPNPEQPPGPHPSAVAELSIDEFLDVLKKSSKLKRTFPAPVH